MPPSSEHVPRTPDRRTSSAALFSAFKSLTTGRLKSPTPPPSVSSTTCTPRTTSIGTHNDSGSVASAPTADDVSKITAVKSGRAPLGGPPELVELVAQVHVSQPLSERTAAIHKISTIAEQYPVRNVLALWAAASDLLLPEQSDDAAEAGYKLLKSCVALPDLTPVERNVFFGAVNLRQGDKYFDLRLGIVSALTQGGRNIEACESFIAPFILNSLDSCFSESRNAFSAARKVQGKKGAEQPKESENMLQLFKYTIDVCRFNSKLFSDEDLELLLQKAMTICQETTQRADIENAIKLFDTVTTYVHIPCQALKPCLEVLCVIHRQLADLQEQTWSTLSNLFRSHIGQAAVSALLHTLLDGPNRKSHQYPMYRGAIQVLQLLLFEDGRGGLQKVPISLLILALRSSIQRVHKTQENLVLGLIAAILTDQNMRDVLMNEGDWSDLIEIIRTCAERDDEREASQNIAPAEKLPIEKATSATGPVSAIAGNTGAPASAASTTGDPETDAISNGDLSAYTTTQIDSLRRRPDDDISKILIALDAMSRNMEPIQKATVMELFMSLPYRLSDTSAEDVIKFFVEERYFHPSNEEWLEACRSLVSGFLKDTTRPRTLRILCIKTMRDTYNTVDGICASDAVLQCAALLLNNIEAEDDVEVLHELVDFAVEVADRACNDRFHDSINLLKRRMDRPRIPPTSPASSPPPWISSALQGRSTSQRVGSPCNVIATAFVRLFTRSVTKSAPKTRTLYEILRHIADSDIYETDARLSALKLLFRLRADSNHALTVSSSSEGESIAAVLYRTVETAVGFEKADDGTPEPGRAEDQLSWREQRKLSGSSPHSSLNRHTSHHNTTSSRVYRPVPPLWRYPGPKGLPEEPSPRSSRVVFSHIDADEYPLSDNILDLEVTLWLELVISLLQRAPDWEIYSYVLVHLGPQLSNQALVRSCAPQLKLLRSVACEQIRNSSFHEPPSYTLLKKADVAVCLFHILTVLISYHDHFEKSEEDDLVKTFLHGMGHWDRTAKWCIHALTVCCQETPLSVSKSLDNVIQKMSQIITKPSTAIHILEFLTSLARMPELYKNFREEEFKMVFGVSFRYLQHVRDQRERASILNSTQSGHRPLRHSGASRDFTSSDQTSNPRKKTAADDLPQYVYALAYHVITFWFMGLKMEDRRNQIPWITKNLIYTDSVGNQVVEEQGQVIIDMMHSVAHSDRDETTRDPNFAKPGDGEVWKKTWIVGNSLLTIETAARTGVSLITTRRPCGTRYLYTRPLLGPPPRHQAPLTVGLASDAFYTSSYVGILPDDIFQTFYAPLHMFDPPIPLPDDQTTRRSIDMFDRNATVDGYKVGVIYIGEGQMGPKNEKDILMNDTSSAPYTSFLNDLGTLVRLKGAKFNTGGLDRSNDTDGEFTYCWRDRCVELIFHITTMMPANPDIDLTYANKKRHIGNDFVNIIFNDSGLPYDFNTFPSAFNYVAIVISPESRASFVDRRLDTDPYGKIRYYKVQVLSKPGFPDISPAVEPKILCGKHLAAYCRLLAINASVFSSVWAIRDGGESISSWRNRLREIKRLRERHGASDLPMVPTLSNPTHHQHNVSSPPSRDNALSVHSISGFHRTSVATFISEGTSRNSLSSASHDAAI